MKPLTKQQREDMEYILKNSVMPRLSQQQQKDMNRVRIYLAKTMQEATA